MQYRLDKYGNELSVLGFGCLRFPQKNGKIDMDATREQIRLAVEEGVNYFDTAYVYPGSEAALGEILESEGLRERVKIATKLPHYLIKSRAGLEKMFREELKRLRTDRVEYYLMHMLCDLDTWERLKKMGIEEWIAAKKASGEIGQIGFSYHGGTEMFCKLVDVYDWDFCQIQYNYLDEHSQAGRRGLHHAAAKGIPVIIMEPLRGGKLVNLLPAEARKVFAESGRGWTPAQWGLRWLWDQKEVTVVLSGMNSREMVLENIRTASDARIGAFGEGEQAVIAKAVAAINAKVKVGCTGCGYCQPCPKHVDIPGAFAAYNRYHTESPAGAKREYLKCTLFRKTHTNAGNCIGCGKCERHCPQGIEIRKELENVRRELEDGKFRLYRRVLKMFRIFG
ncbi:MAG: aldo/keto reductase [Oscillospiraceae bacterium]|nr:aldo/keto reductase [Oscillospiraceae bacterium]